MHAELTQRSAKAARRTAQPLAARTAAHLHVMPRGAAAGRLAARSAGALLPSLHLHRDRGQSQAVC